jgi:hypothetical protein
MLALAFSLVFLCKSLLYAEDCTRTVCVMQPEAGDILTSGVPSYIIVQINNPGVHLSKLKLYYTLVDPPKWKLIALRNCNLFYCPTDYLWAVVWVPSAVTTARIKAVLLDTNGQVVGRDKSDQFQIYPYGWGPFGVSPKSDTICENDKSCTAGKDVAKFTMMGMGMPPYTVTSSRPAVIPHLSDVYYKFNVDAVNGSTETDRDVTLTIKDSGNPQQIATVTVRVINQ